MLLAPAIAVMHRLKYPQKFLLISLVFALPLALVMYFLVSEINERIEFTQKEYEGTRYLRPLRVLLGHVAQSQMQADDYLRRGPSQRPELVRRQLEIEDDLRALAAVQDELGARLRSATAYQVLRENWRFLKERQPTLDAQGSSELHAALMGDIRRLISQVGNTSNLILDPDLDSYYLMDSVLLKLPEVADITRQVWLLGRKVIASGRETSDAERAEFIRLVGLLRSTVDAIRAGMEVAFQNNPAQNLKARLVDPLGAYIGATEQFLVTLDQQFVSGARATLQPEAFDRLGTQFLDASLAYWDRTVVELDGLLLARIDGFAMRRTLVMAFAGLALLLVAWLFVAFYATVVGTVRSLEETTRRMVGGHIDERFQVETRDELGQMAGSFNAIADRLRLEWTQAREESARATAAEAELRVAKDAAESATRSKSIFLANMSHELRTPLNAILGLTELLQDDARKQGRTDEQGLLQRVQRAGQHLLALINEILDLSKIEAGKMELHAQAFVVAELVEDVARMVQPLVASQGNQLTVECTPELGTMVADPLRVRQALLNLASNANKFTEQGKVGIRAWREEGTGGAWIHVAVTDTGIGISAQQMGRLFQEFAQADASTTRKYGGTGLGLAISRRFCQMMGGDIEVQSTPGQGSTFTLRLPARMPTAAQAPDAAAPAAPRVAPATPMVDEDAARGGPDPAIRHGDPSRWSLLVVDDNEDNRFTLTQRLQREGYTRLNSANDGQQALDLLAAQPFDLVLLDVMMPGLNGYQVLEHMRADPRLRQIPVVMISALNEMDSVIRCIELGAEDYLAKPFNATLLRARLGAILEKKGLRDELARAAGRMERELEQARDIQRNMMPREFPPPSADCPVELFAALEPARQTGGDLYDCFWVAPQRLCLVVGDVSDKGASAALYMARTLSALRVLASAPASDGIAPSATMLLEQVNAELTRDNPQAMFVTLFLAILDTATGWLDWCDAGHPAPLVVARDGVVRRISLAPSIPVGVQTTLAPSSGSLQLARGDCLWLFTDGVTEAADGQDQLFGEARLADALRQAASLAPRGMVDSVLQQVRAFVGAAPPSDDIAVLACRWGGDVR